MEKKNNKYTALLNVMKRELQRSRPNTGMPLSRSAVMGR